MTHSELCKAAAVEYFQNVRGRNVEPEPFGYGSDCWCDPETGEFTEIFVEENNSTVYDFAKRGA